MKSQWQVLIVDDEPLACDLVKSLLNKHRDFMVSDVLNDGRSVLDYCGRHRVDLLLLDIKMPGLDGTQVVKKMQQIKNIPFVVFITAYPEHALEAFDLHVSDYIVKPINKQRFDEMLNRLSYQLHQRQHWQKKQPMMIGGCSSEHDDIHVITINTTDSQLNIDCSDIIWLEACNQYTHIHCIDEAYFVSHNLQSLSRKLPENMFVRIHRSSIINTNKIRHLKKNNGKITVTLENGCELNVARSRKSLVPMLMQCCTSS